MCLRGVGHDFLSEFSVSQYQKIHRDTLLFFRNFLVSKKLVDERGGGVSRFSIRNVLSHSAERNRTGIPQCFTDSGVENFYALEGYVMIFCR